MTRATVVLPTPPFSPCARIRRGFAELVLFSSAICILKLFDSGKWVRIASAPDSTGSRSVSVRGSRDPIEKPDRRNHPHWDGRTPAQPVVQTLQRDAKHVRQI